MEYIMLMSEKVVVVVVVVVLLSVMSYKEAERERESACVYVRFPKKTQSSSIQHWSISASLEVAYIVKSTIWPSNFINDKEIEKKAGNAGLGAEFELMI